MTGRLDVMGASQGVLKLDVRPGEIVTALWEGEEPVETLREFFNRDVVVEGVGVFRPSGSLLRVDADAIAPRLISGRVLSTRSISRRSARLPQARAAQGWREVRVRSATRLAARR